MASPIDNVLNALPGEDKTTKMIILVIALIIIGIAIYYFFIKKNQ